MAAALEQKVWLTTSAPLYPNIYTFLVGHPGVGKSRTVHAVGGFVRELTDFHIGDTSMTMAALVDRLHEAKRTVMRLEEGPLEFNSLYLLADELAAFMGKYDDDLVGGLTTFYDVTLPYSQSRRGKDIRIRIKAPQLSILCGTTPSNLIKFMPEFAWDQGFTSRIILVFSDERPMLDDVFAIPFKQMPEAMQHDLRCIHSLVGEFRPSADYARVLNLWRHGGQVPTPQHPRLTHYCARRLTHIFKLSMVASVDRGDSLTLELRDLEQAQKWLFEAEAHMGEIFRAGAIGADAKAMEEILHFINVADAKGEGVHESKIVRFVSERIPPHSVMRVLEIMERSEMIKAVRLDRRTGMKVYAALRK